MSPMPRARRLLGLLVLPLFVGAAALPAQEARRPLTHDDYDRWPSIRATAVSADGKWLAYSVEPAWGDGELHVRAVDGDTVYTHERGTRPEFSADSRFVVFRIAESEVEKRREALAELWGEKKKEKKEKKGGSGREGRGSRGRRGRGRGRNGGDDDELEFAVMDLSDGSVELIEGAKGYRVIDDGAWLLYHLKPEEEKDEEEEGKKEKEGEEGKAEAGKEPGAGKKAEAGKKAGAGEEPAAGKKAAAGEKTTAGEKTEAGKKKAGGKTEAGKKKAGEKQEEQDEEEDEKKDDKKDGTPLVLRNLKTGEETRHPGVVSYSTVAEDAWILLECSSTDEDAGVTDGLIALHPEEGKRVVLAEGAAEYSGFTTDRNHRRLAFTSDLFEKERLEAEREAKEAAEKAEEAAAKEEGGAGEAGADEADDEEEDEEEPRHDIWLWDFSGGAARRLVTQATDGLPLESEIQASGLRFSDDGNVLRFGIKEEDPPELPKILDEEKVVLDIWHWNDGYIQPMQARRAGRERNPTLHCVYHIEDGRLVPLGDERMPTVELITTDGSRALATDSGPYEKLVTWDGRYSDIYLVNTVDGSRKKILTGLRSGYRSRARPSPTGKWIVYFGEDYEWYAIDTQSLEEHCLTDRIEVAFENELEDRPQPARPYGIVGWTPGDRAVVLYDRWDLWRIDVASGKASCMTDGFGRANRIELRYSRFDLEGDDDELDPAERQYLPETILLSAQEHATKAEGYYIDSTVEVAKPRKLVMLDRNIGGLRRPDDAERLFFTLSTFAEFPDIWVADMEFGDRRKLTDACPIQREVRWGSSELVTWHNDEGLELQGILVKPDGFDPQKEYPMMVYFYERRSDNLHRYRRPSPGTSPNPSYYVSNGYLWFVPDIVYEIGYPGESAEKCVVSGVQHLIGKGFVDEDAIGIAGHSWGGYQTAHLVTRTDLFAAAESGAPVSNMFSAYGGIRYGSGMSRQFQYERTQSRIGGTPWEYPMRYWQNSPLFYADRVETPVLILHNDEDGAVPWTNGIEFFMALRRLGKEAYLFNYNGAGHGLRKDANQKDWARRMAQFFDHHLKGAPAPRWMTEGVPYIDRMKEKIPHARSFIEAKAEGKLEPEAVEAVTGEGGGGK